MNGTVIAMVVTGVIGLGMAGMIVLKEKKIDELNKELGQEEVKLNQCQSSNESLELNLLEMEREARKNKERAEKQEEKLEVVLDKREKERAAFSQQREELQEELDNAESTNCSVANVRPDFIRLYEQTRTDSEKAGAN